MSSRPTVDGEYDPVTAAANRAAASKQAAQKQEADRLRREAEAKKAAEQAATAARIAQLKAKQAETAATLERTRLSAEKRAQDAARRDQEEAARKAVEPRPVDISRPRVGAEKGITKPEFTPIPSMEVMSKPQVQAAVSNFLDGWAATNDKLYAKGNFMNDLDKAAMLKEVQENPILGYELMTSTKPQKPPKTIEEALNRLKYVVSEITLGGAREVALPMSIKAGQPRRVEDAILQVTGGLLTPSPADLLVSEAVRALVGIGKKGNRILQKVMNGVPLGTDEAKQFEKLVGQYGYSTSDLRKAGTKLGKLTQAEWDEFLVKYQKHYDYWNEVAKHRSAGAAYQPSALQEFSELMDDIGYDVDEYIDFLKENKLNPTMNPATLIAFINGVKPPTPDLKAYEKIESDLEKYRESLKQSLKEATEEAVITGPVSRTGPKQPDPTLPGYTPPEEEEEQAVITGPVSRTGPKQPDPTLPGYTPPEEEEEQAVITGPVSRTGPKQPDPTLPGYTPPEEEPTPPPSDEPVPPVPRKKGDSGMRPNVFRALVGGLKEKYRIVFDYPKGKSESFTVTARSFPQALSQATQLRRVKYVPSEVDIVKKGKG